MRRAKLRATIVKHIDREQMLPLSPFMLLWLIVGCLAGCARTPSDQLEDYLIRIGRVLEVEVPEQRLVPVRVYSVKRNRIPQPERRIGLLDFIRINQCQLAQAVGFKNSPLGKVAGPSQTMHIERDILTHARSCINRLKKGQPELAKKLESIVELKKRQRMQTWWNAWSTGDEWQEFSALSANAIEFAGPQPAHLSLSLLALDYALSQGYRWREGSYAYSSRDMEKHLHQLLLGQSLGRWRKSVILSTQMLERAANMLEQRMANMPLCRHGPTPRAQTLHNVFMTFLIGRMQPYLNRTDWFGDQLLGRLNDMAELATAPEDFRKWLQELEQLHQTFEQANMRHIAAWQNTLEECGLAPGLSK